jgi:hypothetical protein
MAEEAEQPHRRAALAAIDRRPAKGRMGQLRAL